VWSEDTAFEGGLPAPSDRMVGLVFVKGGAGIDVCGGVVSSKSGSFWCTTKGAECTTASHGTNIIILAQNHVFAAGMGREGSGEGRLPPQMRLRVIEPDDWLSPFRMNCWSTSPQGGL
jgi:hypothetical protein